MQNPLPIDSHIHFVGIGGIGMSALAAILVEQGYSVSGSDRAQNKRLESLLKKGIRIFKTQNPENINKICKVQNRRPLIVFSSAITNENSELQAAKEKNLKIIHRSEILALLIKNYKSLVVAGSHGKTTTSTFISTLFALAKKDPTIAIGGIVPYYKSNNNIGKSKFFIAEGDESDGTLIKLNPKIGLITNIDLDHIDHYRNIHELIKIMKDFGKNCEILIGNYDCQNIKNNIQVHASYSIKQTKNIDFSVIPIELNGHETIANYYEKEKLISKITIPIPGIHNLSNFAGAISACRLAGIKFKELEEGITNLKTPLRRFQYKGCWEGRLIIDDYAHHPNEIKACISLAELMINNPKSILPSTPKRLIAVFQPHRFSRTKVFINEFAASLANSNAKTILIAPIFSAGEENKENICNTSIAKKIKQLNSKSNVYLANNYVELITLIKEKSIKDDLILNMGAGDINSIWDRLNSSDILENKELVA